MALKDTWEDLQNVVAGDPDSGSEISVEPINKIAHAVIDLEEDEDFITNTAPYIGENGNWFEWDNLTQKHIDTGIKAQGENGKDGQSGVDGKDGYTPIRGTDYWTESDIAEIKGYVDEAILGGAW